MHGFLFNAVNHTVNRIVYCITVLCGRSTYFTCFKLLSESQVKKKTMQYPIHLSINYSAYLLGVTENVETIPDDFR